MVADAVKSYPGKDIYVVGKNSSSDKKRMAYIKSLGKSMGRPVPRENVEKIKGPDDINYYENNALQVLQFLNGKFIKK